MTPCLLKVRHINIDLQALVAPMPTVAWTVEAVAVAGLQDQDAAVPRGGGLTLEGFVAGCGRAAPHLGGRIYELGEEVPLIGRGTDYRLIEGPTGCWFLGHEGVVDDLGWADGLYLGGPAIWLHGVGFCFCLQLSAIAVTGIRLLASVSLIVVVFR
jgi:hypothetical protein